MAKYLFRASYTQAGVKGLIKEGGTGRRDALRQTVEGLGGTLEGFYYAFGNEDLLLIADFPSEEEAAAFSMFLSAAGALTMSCTVLITPEIIDGAVRKNVIYRSPGD